MNREITSLAIIVNPGKPMHHPDEMGHGACERMVWWASQLLSKEYEVTVFAAAGSKVPNGVNLHEIKIPRNQIEGLKNPHAFLEIQQTAISQLPLDDYTIIHNHLIGGIRSLEENYRLDNRRYLTTIHCNPIQDWRYTPELANYPTHPYVAISQWQTKKRSDLNWIGIVPNGTNVAEFKLNSNPDEYLLYINRLMPWKRPDLAIKVAQRTGRPLIMAGPKMDHVFPGYFDTLIAPHLGTTIQWVGEMPGNQTKNLFEHAYALLVTNFEFREPFGQSSIEAMACGTPVVTTDQGCPSEVVINNQTGFIVPIGGKDEGALVQALAEAVKSVEGLQREVCRSHVEKNFSIETMVEGYQRLYRMRLED